MPYTVSLYKFSKRRNSTARISPDATAERFTCEILGDSTITNPVIVLNAGSRNPTGNNYAHLSELWRYYFIENWVYDAGLWKAYLTIDSLATYKTAIGSMSAYVLRSASNYDNYIPDNKYPIKAGATFNATSQNANPFATSFGNGSFVLGIINSDSGSIGAVSYYVFTNSQLRSFSNYLLSNVALYGVTDVSDQLTKILYNPFQYVVSAIWLPFDAPVGATVTNIPIGWWTAPVTAKRLSGMPRASGTVTCQIPRNPEASLRPYMNAEPYTEYYLDFPPFGTVSISADNLINATLVDFAWDCDCISGEGKLSIGADNSSKPFNVLKAQIGVPIQLAQMAPDVRSIAQQALGNFNSGSAFIDSALNKAADIGSALLARAMPIQSVGSNGGFMAGYYPIRLTGIFHGIAEESTAEFGRPLCKTVTISTLSGYVQCAHGEFKSPSAMSSEIDTINSYLTSGFYFE